jgi:hypothetical protein
MVVDDSVTDDRVAIPPVLDLCPGAGFIMVRWPFAEAFQPRTGMTGTPTSRFEWHVD